MQYKHLAYDHQVAFARLSVVENALKLIVVGWLAWQHDVGQWQQCGLYSVVFAVVHFTTWTVAVWKGKLLFVVCVSHTLASSNHQRVCMMGFTGLMHWLHGGCLVVVIAVTMYYVSVILENSEVQQTKSFGIIINRDRQKSLLEHGWNCQKFMVQKQFQISFCFFTKGCCSFKRFNCNRELIHIMLWSCHVILCSCHVTQRAVSGCWGTCINDLPQLIRDINHVSSYYVLCLLMWSVKADSYTCDLVISPLSFWWQNLAGDKI